MSVVVWTIIGIFSAVGASLIWDIVGLMKAFDKATKEAES